MPERDDALPLIGEPGQPIEAFAFRGGGFNTVMALGVVHALLLLGRKDPPHIVSGISAGAVAAAAMADILGLRSREQKAARLREFLTAYVQAPSELLTSLLPDPYEIEARKHLGSLVQPTHIVKERAERNEALAARLGIIKLANDLLSIGLPVSVLTRLLRTFLALRAVHETRGFWRRRKQYGVLLIGLWMLLLTNTHHLVPLLGRLAYRLLEGGPERRKAGYTAGRLLSVWPRVYEMILLVVLDAFAALLYLGVLAATLTAPLVLIGCGLGLVASACGLGQCSALAFRCPAKLVIVVGAVIIPLGLAWWWGRWPSRWLRDRLLRSYDLRKELGSSYDLRRLLIRMFDENYYGGARLREVQESSIVEPRPKAMEFNGAKRSLADLARGDRLHVVPAVADLANKALTVIPDTLPTRRGTRLVRTDESVVDSLLAALAVTPYLKPVQALVQDARTDDKTTTASSGFVLDGTNIANEPIAPLFEYMRGRVRPDAGAVTIYAVSSVPSARSFPGDPALYTGLIDVVTRVIDLQRHQVAKLERQLTECYTRVLEGTRTPTRAVHTIPDGSDQGRVYFGATITPIEPEFPLAVERRLLTSATEGERRKVILEAVAEGCRASLKVFLDPSSTPQTVRGCPGSAAGLTSLPGADVWKGPGLPEICEHCRTCGSAPDRPTTAGEPVRAISGASAAPFVLPARPAPTHSEPWTALLLSGGVFRGVFQIGVIVGASEAGLQPRLFVGSSVGSLVAAMSARLFSLHGDKRDAAVAELAATFLALDRLVLTDGFADFVRRFTLRAGATRVSMRDLDRVFRRYDLTGTNKFGRITRGVVAGIERLFFFTPFELLRLVEAFRLQEYEKVWSLSRAGVQNLLNRSGVGLEILGAEPLAWLIAQHVLPEVEPNALRSVPFDHFRDARYDKFLLATATNLHRGELVVLGMEGASGGKTPARLLDALLASSAFPGAFRPRHYSEVIPNQPFLEQFTDGGVMDNLPLYSVAEFFAKAQDSGIAVRRPVVDKCRVPHLLLTASLEPYTPILSDDEAEAMAQDWMDVSERAKRIRYNQKADSFAKAQADFRQIHDHRVRSGLQPIWSPVDLEVQIVKSRWLCGTFAFHPMMGFRRERQAASIAHGCASTLARLFLRKRTTPKSWGDSWGLRLEDFAEETVRYETCDATAPPVLTPQESPAPGQCWFRTERASWCPFSRQRLERLLPDDRPSAQVVEAIDSIYQACGKPATHRAE